MKKSKFLLIVVLLLVVSVLITACKVDDETKVTTEGESTEEVVSIDDSKGDAENKVYKVGTTGLFEDILKAAEEDFENNTGYDLEIITFTDAITPNVALEEKSLDATFHQNTPYLKQYNKDNNTDFAQFKEGIVTTFYGLYSEKISDISELENGDTIAVPSDASNRTRAMRMLEDLGVIKLDPNAELPTALDVVENPKEIEIVEMDGWAIVTNLQDVTCGATSSSVALRAEIDPKTAIATDGTEKTGEYCMILVVRDEDSDNEIANELYNAMRTDSMKQKLDEIYKGGMLPLF